jgi:SAM-dependent methyltransferase
MNAAMGGGPGAELVAELVCPACGGSETSGDGSEVFDDRYGQPGVFHLVACQGCGHVMTQPRLRESELPGLYGTYYPRKSLSTAQLEAEARSTVSRWHALRRWWLGTGNQGQYAVRRGERMLDVGCGAGVSLLEARLRGAQAYGIEADPNVQRIAAELGLCIHQGSLHDEPFPGVRFDLIVLNQVIEHIPEPDRALQRLRPRLTPAGRIVLVFPNRRSLWCRLSGRRWINWHIPYHLHHFDAPGFRRMARRCGYDVTGMRSITPNLWTVLQLHALRTRPERGVPTAMWRVPAADAALPGTPARRWSPRAVLLVTVLSVLALVNRVVDACGAGDSLMVEIRPAVAA